MSLLNRQWLSLYWYGLTCQPGTVSRVMEVFDDNIHPPGAPDG
jgi:hypothetical protein